MKAFKKGERGYRFWPLQPLRVTISPEGGRELFWNTLGNHIAPKRESLILSAAKFADKDDNIGYVTQIGGIGGRDHSLTRTHGSMCD